MATTRKIKPGVNNPLASGGTWRSRILFSMLLLCIVLFSSHADAQTLNRFCNISDTTRAACIAANTVYRPIAEAVSKGITSGTEVIMVGEKSCEQHFTISPQMINCITQYSAVYNVMRLTGIPENRMHNTVDSCVSLSETIIKYGSRGAQIIAMYYGVPIPNAVLTIGIQSLKHHGITSCEQIYNKQFDRSSLVDVCGIVTSKDTVDFIMSAIQGDSSESAFASGASMAVSYAQDACRTPPRTAQASGSAHAYAGSPHEHFLNPEGGGPTGMLVDNRYEIDARLEGQKYEIDAQRDIALDKTKTERYKIEIESATNRYLAELEAEVARGAQEVDLKKADMEYQAEMERIAREYDISIAEIELEQQKHALQYALGMAQDRTRRLAFLGDMQAQGMQGSTEMLSINTGNIEHMITRDRNHLITPTGSRAERAQRAREHLRD